MVQHIEVPAVQLLRYDQLLRDRGMGARAGWGMGPGMRRGWGWGWGAAGWGAGRAGGRRGTSRFLFRSTSFFSSFSSAASPSRCATCSTRQALGYYCVKGWLRWFTSCVGLLAAAAAAAHADAGAESSPLLAGHQERPSAAAWHTLTAFSFIMSQPAPCCWCDCSSRGPMCWLPECTGLTGSACRGAICHTIAGHANSMIGHMGYIGL